MDQQNLFDMEQRRLQIEGLFYVEDEKHPCIEKAEELDIEIEDGMIILKRDIAANGKSVCRVNGKLVTLSILKEIGKPANIMDSAKRKI